MSPGGSGFWKTLLIPPLFALLFYILITYLILPYYRRLRSHSSYTLLPSSLTPSSSSPADIAFAGGLLSRINALIGRGSRRASGESLMGDEELGEDFANFNEAIGDGERRSRIDIGAGPNNGERRLSRDLESGFRDSSDEEEEDDRRQLRP